MSDKTALLLPYTFTFPELLTFVMRMPVTCECHTFIRQSHFIAFLPLLVLKDSKHSRLQMVTLIYILNDNIAYRSLCHWRRL